MIAQKHTLYKKADEDLQKRINKIATDIKNRQSKKFNIGTNSNSALNNAKSGLFSKDIKKETNAIEQAVLTHANNTKKKISFREKQLDQSERKLNVLKAMASSITNMAMTDDDYVSELEAFVRENFRDPELEQILDIIDEFERRFARFWRIVFKYPDRYSKEKKITEIRDMVKRYKNKK